MLVLLLQMLLIPPGLLYWNPFEVVITDEFVLLEYRFARKGSFPVGGLSAVVVVFVVVFVVVVDDGNVVFEAVPETEPFAPALLLLLLVVVPWIGFVVVAVVVNILDDPAIRLRLLKSPRPSSSRVGRFLRMLLLSFVLLLMLL